MHSTHGHILYHFPEIKRYIFKHPAFGAPVTIPFCLEKIEWRGYIMVKKWDDIFSHFDTISVRDGWTDRRTDRHLATAQSMQGIA